MRNQFVHGSITTEGIPSTIGIEEYPAKRQDECSRTREPSSFRCKRSRAHAAPQHRSGERERPYETSNVFWELGKGARPQRCRMEEQSRHDLLLKVDRSTFFREPSGRQIGFERVA